jgi:hypothetical protein
MVDSILSTTDPDSSFPHALYGGRRILLQALRNAQDQASVAARNMLGARERYMAVPWFWADQYDFHLAAPDVQLKRLCLWQPAPDETALQMSQRSVSCYTE